MSVGAKGETTAATGGVYDVTDNQLSNAEGETAVETAGNGEGSAATEGDARVAARTVGPCTQYGLYYYCCLPKDLVPKSIKSNMYSQNAPSDSC